MRSSEHLSTVCNSFVVFWTFILQKTKSKQNRCFLQRKKKRKKILGRAKNSRFVNSILVCKCGSNSSSIFRHHFSPLFELNAKNNVIEEVTFIHRFHSNSETVIVLTILIIIQFGSVFRN